MFSRRGRNMRRNFSQGESSNVEEDIQLNSPIAPNIQVESDNMQPNIHEMHEEPSTNQNESLPTLITPEGTGFNPNNKDVCTAIVAIFKDKFNGPWNCWSEVPLEYQQLWFHEFQKCYYWEPAQHHQIWRNWKNKVQKRLKDIIAHVRDTRKKPPWIQQQIWEELCEHWDSNEFRANSEQKKKYRAAASLHTGGSTSMEEHARNLARELGRDPSFSELYQKTHHRKSTNSWVDEKSKAVWDEYLRQKESIDSSSSSNNTTDINLFVNAAGGKKKGVVYGFGNISYKIVGDARTGYSYNPEASSSQVPPYPHANYIQDMIRNEFVNMSTKSYQSRFEDQQQQIEELRTQLQEITRSTNARSQGRRNSSQPTTSITQRRNPDSIEDDSEEDD